MNTLTIETTGTLLSGSAALTEIVKRESAKLRIKRTSVAIKNPVIIFPSFF